MLLFRKVLAWPFWLLGVSVLAIGVTLLILTSCVVHGVPHTMSRLQYMSEGLDVANDYVAVQLRRLEAKVESNNG